MPVNLTNLNTDFQYLFRNQVRKAILVISEKRLAISQLVSQTLRGFCESTPVLGHPRGRQAWHSSRQHKHILRYSYFVAYTNPSMKYEGKVITSLNSVISGHHE